MPAKKGTYIGLIIAAAVVGGLLYYGGKPKEKITFDPLKPVHITNDAGYLEANREALEFGKTVFPKAADNQEPTASDIDSLQKMIRLYDGMLAYKPGNPLPNLTAGESFFILKKYPDAIQRLQQFLVATQSLTDSKIVLARGDAHYLLSQAFFAEQNYKQSLSEIDAALKINPNVSNYLTQRASVSIQLKDLPDAVKYAQAALKLDPSDEHAKGIIDLANAVQGNSASHSGQEKSSGSKDSKH